MSHLGQSRMQDSEHRANANRASVCFSPRTLTCPVAGRRRAPSASCEAFLYARTFPSPCVEVLAFEHLLRVSAIWVVRPFLPLMDRSYAKSAVVCQPWAKLNKTVVGFGTACVRHRPHLVDCGAFPPNLALKVHVLPSPTEQTATAAAEAPPPGRQPWERQRTCRKASAGIGTRHRRTRSESESSVRREPPNRVQQERSGA